jgi:hypothetical protein
VVGKFGSVRFLKGFWRTWNRTLGSGEGDA